MEKTKAQIAAEELYIPNIKTDNPEMDNLWNAIVLFGKAGFIHGYNAAIQSQSVQPTGSDKDKKVVKIDGGKPKSNNDGTMSITPLVLVYEDGTRSDDKEPTGSVRERIKRYQRQMDAHDENFVTSNDVQDLKESYYYKGRRDEAYDSAAANLPVGNGWIEPSESEIDNAAMGCYDIDRPYSEDEMYKAFRKGVEWLQQYKLTHSPIANK